jgi:hypothetical protein
MLHITAGVDPRMNNLPADESVYRVIHVSWCNDKKPWPGRN